MDCMETVHIHNYNIHTANFHFVHPEEKNITIKKHSLTNIDREKQELNLPCIEHWDHLHQKSYGGPPIPRVFQNLNTVSNKLSP